MKAALFLGPDSIKFADVPAPVIGDTQALVRVKVCTIDGAARAIFKGKMAPRKKLPMVLGMQISGEVEATGSNARSVKPGDRVHVSAHTSCRACYYCLRGQFNLCENIRLFGIDLDGGFEEYIAAPAHALYRVPSELSDEEASLLTADLCCAFHAVSRAQIEMNDTVAIFGTGGLGTCILQIASKLRGAKAIVIGRNVDQLRLAEAFGASSIVDSQVEDPVTRVKELTHGVGADVAIEAAGVPDIMSQAIGSVRKGGRAIIMGASMSTLPVEVRRLFREEVAIIGSNNSVPDRELPVVLDALMAGKVDLKESVKQRTSFDELTKGFELLEKGTGGVPRVCVRIS